MVKLRPKLWGGIGRDGLHVKGSDLSPMCASVFCDVCGEELGVTVDPLVSPKPYDCRLETLISDLARAVQRYAWMFTDRGAFCEWCADDCA